MSRFTKGAHEGLVPVLHDYDEYRSDNENEEDDCRESAELRFYAGRLRKENGISFEKISSRSAFVLFFKTFSLARQDEWSCSAALQYISGASHGEVPTVCLP